MTRDEQIQLVKRENELPDLVWVERPTLLHDRASGPGVCPCGCGSQSGEDPEDWAATLVQTIPGPTLIINRHTGQRKYRDRTTTGEPRSPQEIEAFDRLRDHCEVVYLPRRCYPKQLIAIAARPHVKGVFGGVRGGKTESLAEELVDVWIELGGPGVILWWVAPLHADTLRGVEKLITGKTIRGGANPEVRPGKLPDCLVLDYPKGTKERALEQIKRRKPITLLDGTTIELRYANSGDGAPLQGDNPAWIAVDEGALIKSVNTWSVMIQRVTDAGGWVSTATTPKVGSPLKHLVYDEGEELVAANDAPLTGWAHLTMEDNPWVRPREVEKQRLTTLKQPNGQEQWEQDGKGKWIVPGQRMWDYFDESLHVITGPWRDVEHYQVDGRPLIDITEQAARRFWWDTTADLTKGVAGQDFNTRGHFTEVFRVAHPEGTDPGNPDNWVVVFLDEIRKAGDAWKAAQWLAKKAGAMRGLDPDHYANLAISCDATGAQDQIPESDTDNVRVAYGKADAFIKWGFDMRPCHVTAKGKPKNPGKYEQCGLMHMVQRDRAQGQHADDYPGGVALPGVPPRTRFLVHKQFCPELIKGLREQVATDRGVPFKRSDTLSDRLSDPVDAGLYGLWAIYAEHEYDQGVEIDYG